MAKQSDDRRTWDISSQRSARSVDTSKPVMSSRTTDISETSLAGASVRSSRTVDTSKTLRPSRTTDISQTSLAGASVSESVANSEMLRMCLQLEDMKRTREQRQEQQEKKYGLTVDAAEALRVEIHRTKTNNATLLEEMEVAKQKFDRLEHVMEQLKLRFVSCQKELRALKKERTIWDNTTELLSGTERRCLKLSKINQKLRDRLMQHHINPDEKIRNTRVVNKTVRNISSPVRQNNPINAVSIRQRLSPQKIFWN